MVEYLFGDIIKAASIVNPGEGRYIEEYEWKWDNTIITDIVMPDIISYDTSLTTAGVHVLSLRVLNDCGEWSNIATQTITILSPSGNISVDNAYILGDIVNISWSDVTVTGASLFIVNSAGVVVKSWVVDTATGTTTYTIPVDAPEGAWWVYLDYGTYNLDYKSFSVGVCPVPTVSITLT